MLNNNKIRGNIGMSYAAKSIVLGTDNIIAAMKNNRAKLVLLSSNASFNTQKLIQNKARSFDCEVVMIMEEDENILSEALGKEKIVVIAITNNNFKKMVLRNIKGD